MKIKSRWLSQFLVLLLPLFLCGQLTYAQSDNHKTLKSPKPLPEFVLNDQFGKFFSKDKLKGKWSMIFIGFAACPDACPFTLANLEAVRADMGFRMRPDNIPNIIFLSVDPDRDTPLLKEYLYYYHPEYIGITGKVSEIDKLIKGLDAYYKLDKKTPTDTAYNVVHSGKVAVINPEGEIVAEISPPFKPHSTGEYLINLIRSFDS